MAFCFYGFGVPAFRGSEVRGFGLGVNYESVQYGMVRGRIELSSPLSRQNMALGTL